MLAVSIRSVGRTQNSRSNSSYAFVLGAGDDLVVNISIQLCMSVPMVARLPVPNP